MKHITIGLLIAGLTVSGAARADIISSGSLQNLNGQYGSGIATTTTDSTGRQTNVAGPGGGANRASGIAVTGAWFQANVGGDGTVGITNNYAFDGNGSAYFSTTSGNSKGDLQYYFAPTALSSLTSIAYDFYRSSASATDPNLAPVFRIDIAKDGAFAGSLVLENYYQNQQSAPVDSWTQLTATLNQGIFWATNAALGPTFAAANGGQKTLQSWIDANSGSALSVYGMSIGVGSGWNGLFQGAIDEVAIAFAGGPNLTSNFEVAGAAAVPEPASLVLIAAGLGALGLIRRRQAG